METCKCVFSRLALSRAITSAVIFGLHICSTTAVNAREPGSGPTFPPGQSLGVPTGENLPLGLWLESQFSYYAADTTAPGSSHIVGPKQTVGVVAERLLWRTPWTFLGASEMMWGLAPFVDLSISDIPALNNQQTYQRTAIANPIFSPINLSWTIAHETFASIELTFVPPIGQFNRNNVINVGDNFWTFQPEASITYVGDGLDLTVHAIYSHNTRSQTTHYLSGDVLNFDVTATKKIGPWEFGAVGYVDRQVSGDDNGGDSYGPARPTFGNPEQIALGGLAGYKLGSVHFQLYFTQDVMARGGAAQGTKGHARILVPLF